MDMKSIRISLPEVRTVRISFGRTVRVKKPTLRETLELSALFGALAVHRACGNKRGVKRTEREIVRLTADRVPRPFLARDGKKIVDAVRETIRLSDSREKPAQSDSSSENPHALQRLIAEFGTKEVLDWYPDEIALVLREREKIRAAEAYRSTANVAGATHSPKETLERLWESAVRPERAREKADAKRRTYATLAELERKKKSPVKGGGGKNGAG